MPTRRRSSTTSSDRLSKSSPCRVRVPLARAPGIGSFIRFIQRRKVLLPQPDGPINAVTRHLGISSEMPLSACTLPYQLSNPCARMAMGSVSATGADAAAGATTGVAGLMSMFRGGGALGGVVMECSWAASAVGTLQAMADDDRQGIEGEEDGEQHDDAGSGQLMESRLLAHGPVIDL